MRRLVVLGVAAIGLALAARAWFDHAAREASAPVFVDSTGTSLRAAALWFASPDGDSLAGETRELAEVNELHARLAALVAALAQGPRQGGVPTLPEGTELLHAYFEEGGLLTLDLSLPFRQGFRGGPRAEEMAIGSLVRTLAANVPEARRIRLVCGGAPLPSLGGHFPLDQPLDPEDWP